MIDVTATPMSKERARARVCSALLTLASLEDRRHAYFCGRCGGIGYAYRDPLMGTCRHPPLDRFTLGHMRIPDLLAFEQMVLNAIEYGGLTLTDY